MFKIALIKSYTNNQGIVLDYWVITSIKRDTVYKTVEITLSGYLSIEAKNSGYQPIEVRRIKITWENGMYDKYFSIDVLNSDTNDIAQGYKYIKENESMFVDSLDQ